MAHQYHLKQNHVTWTDVPSSAFEPPVSTGGSFFINRKDNNSMNIIGIDHGFGYTKTANTCFSSGVTLFENEPYTQRDVLKLNKKYYVCGSG
jgi:hypothetical protein